MEEYLKKFKLRKMGPELKEKIMREVKKEVYSPHTSFIDKLWLSRIYWFGMATAYIILIVINIYFNRTYENRLVKDYGFCPDMECRIEMLNIVKSYTNSKGLFDVSSITNLNNGGVR